jgi:hypothetical protein
MRQHGHFKFSVVIQSEDLFMLSAMRGLARQCQSEINPKIAAAGASNAQWKANRCKTTFYFTSRSNRTMFLDEVSILFVTGWKNIHQDNNKTAPYHYPVLPSFRETPA